jgi:pyridinium-3,5-biscarboxylic acid mononucleotide sulfurtransferase
MMSVMSLSIENKRRRLLDDLRRAGKVIVAYSGGVDSALLMAVAHEVLGENAVAVTAVSPSLAARELRTATELAVDRGWDHRIVQTRELDREEYARNSSDRCYWCKTELFEVLAPLALQEGGRLAVGTNADDLNDYRPGLRAAAERHVLTPLADAGLSKGEVRTLSKLSGLPTVDKPASPCLASRFAYGVRVSEAGLKRIDEAEEILRAEGFDVLRVRDHGDLARIEVPSEEIDRVVELHRRIAPRLLALGFKYVTVDLAGFRSGSLNEALLQPSMGRPNG